MSKNNFFANIPQNLPEEFFETIVQSGNVRIEKIVSDGHISQQNFWYDQNQNEFVLLLQGSAIIEFENDESIELKVGDYQIISAHQKHRVSYTDKNKKTIWLAIFYS